MVQSALNLPTYVKGTDEPPTMQLLNKHSTTSIRNMKDRKPFSRKRGMSNSGSLMDLQKMELAQLKENYLYDDVIEIDNVRNVVATIQSVESSLHHKYDEHKAGLQRSVDMVDAQADLAWHIKKASDQATQNREIKKYKERQRSNKDFQFENAKKINALNMLILQHRSTDRIKVLNQGYHGQSNASILSRDGFVKQFSRPANPNENDHIPYDTPVMDYITLKKESENRLKELQQQKALNINYKMSKTPHTRSKLHQNTNDLDMVIKNKFIKRNDIKTIGISEKPQHKMMTLQASPSKQTMGGKPHHVSQTGPQTASAITTQLTPRSQLKESSNQAVQHKSHTSQKQLPAIVSRRKTIVKTGAANSMVQLKLRPELMNRIDTLIKKKHEEDEELEQQIRFWGKQKALENSNSIFNENVNIKELEHNLTSFMKKNQLQTSHVSNARIKKEEKEALMMDLENYGGDTNDYKRHVQRQDQDPAGRVIHENYGRYRGNNSVIDVFVSPDDENDKQLGLKGVNHLLQAVNTENKIEKNREMRMKPQGTMTIQEQNALFPNNAELRLKKALGKMQDVEVTEAAKNLDQRLEADDLALQHQKYLINGVINRFQNNKVTFSSAHKNLVHLQMQKWVQQRAASNSKLTSDLNTQPTGRLKQEQPQLTTPHIPRKQNANNVRSQRQFARSALQ